MDQKLGAQSDTRPLITRPEMMGSLELGPEADVSQLEPLLTLENIEQLEATFVSKVRVSSWGPGSEQLCPQLWACICGVTWLPVSSRVSALLHSAAPCPFRQASVVQWLQKALEGEVAEWGREREPDTDPSGFYHSPMPAIVLQVGGKWQPGGQPSYRKRGDGGGQN